MRILSKRIYIIVCMYYDMIMLSLHFRHLNELCPKSVDKKIMYSLFMTFNFQSTKTT